MAVVYDTKVASQTLSEALLMLDTSRIVARGYAIVKKGCRSVSSAKDLKKLIKVALMMRDGQVRIRVKDVKTEEIWENLAELETIVQRLRKQESSIEDAIAAFSKRDGLIKGIASSTW